MFADRPAYRPLLGLAAAVAALLTATSHRVGVFGDELYFVAAGGHPDWGYVDQPPLVPLLARALWDVSGGSLTVLRAPATLLTALAVLLAGLTAYELGGGRRAQVLTAAVAGVSVGFLATGHVLATSTVDPVLWVTVIWLLLRWLRLRDDRLLLAAGLVTAVAVQVKFLIGTFWLVLIVAVLIAGPRELLRRPLLWAGGAVTLVSLAPGLLWQHRHGWPQFAMTSVIAAEQQQTAGGRAAFLPLTLVLAGLVAGAALAVLGGWSLLRDPDRRFLGLTVLGVLLIFLASGGRQTYASGLLPLCWAAGAVRIGPAPARGWRWVTAWPSVTLTLLVTLVTALPVRPVAQQVQVDYVARGSTGWPELVDAVAAVHDALPAAQRSDLTLVADTFWQASALDVHGRERGLPRPYSPNRGFGLFGVPPETAMTLYVGAEPPPGVFPVTRRLAWVTNPHGFTAQNDAVGIYLCTGRDRTWADLWESLRSDVTRPLVW